MIWHYKCPQCGESLTVDWRWLKLEVTCPQCHKVHYPPTPSEDHYAYIEGDKWPKELEDVVASLRGTTCAVPGCYEHYSTLVHRISVSKGGRTSVDNLLPMCSRHAQLKGEQNYEEWLATLTKEPRTKDKPFEITFTTKKHAPEPEPGRYIGYAQTIAGKVNMPDKSPPGMKLLVAAPFLPGPSQRVAFDYDWRLDAKGKAIVLLIAWHRNEPPDIANLDKRIEGYRAVNELDGKPGEHGTAELELALPQPAQGFWVAAVFVSDQGGKPAIGNYLLVATD